MKRIILIMVMCLLFLSIAHADLNLDIDRDFDIIVVNSEDWEDVYSAMLAGKLIDKKTYFIRSFEEINKLNAKIGSEKRILLIESKQNKAHNNLRAYLQSRMHDVIEYDFRDSVNFGLFEDLKPQGVIIVDRNYGYDAISVTPYALLTKAFVVFATADNIDQVRSQIISDAQEVIIYGFVDLDVIDELSLKDPIIINKESKFENNIEIVKRFIDKSPSTIRSARFTNGEFIEESLFNRNNPIIFIGQSRVPRQVEEFLGTSDIVAATLIGPDLASLASSLRNTLSRSYDKNMTIMALVGQSSAASDQSQIDPLSMFPIRLYSPDITIDSIRYNPLENHIELTIRNNNDLNVFFLSSITINVDGQRLSYGDEDIEFIGRSRTKTLVYPAEIIGENINGTVSIDFGGFPQDFERRIIYSFERLPIVEVLDNSEIEIRSVTYDRWNKAFVVEVRNTGSVTTYVDIELEDVIVDGRGTMLTPNSMTKIDPKKSAKIPIRAEQSNLDMQENENINLIAYYGQRDTALFKIERAELKLEIGTHPAVYYTIIIVIVIIVIILALARKKKNLDSGKDTK